MLLHKFVKIIFNFLCLFIDILDLFYKFSGHMYQFGVYIGIFIPIIHLL